MAIALNVSVLYILLIYLLILSINTVIESNSVWESLVANMKFVIVFLGKKYTYKCGGEILFRESQLTRFDFFPPK